NMPVKLSRIVKCQHPGDPAIWIRDESWYVQISEIYGALRSFLTGNGLVAKDLTDVPLEETVIMLSDLTGEGQALDRSGAIDRWLGSFDRPGSKKRASKMSILVKALETIRAG
ncbi:MAG: hypothetical protein JHC88_04780, partial [Niveispirillum sp.]|nr:hypothetical protein [Niveispirillum sp.]